MTDMTNIAQSFLGSVWALFKGVTIPGFGISAAKVFIGFFVIKFSLNLLAALTGFRSSVSSTAEQFRSGGESVSHYRKLRTQHENYRRNGGIGFHD